MTLGSVTTQQKNKTSQSLRSSQAKEFRTPRGCFFAKRFSTATQLAWMHFEKTQSDHQSKDRFKWDYWHVEDRYSHFRTPAELYFPVKIRDRLESDLQAWGKAHLGCSRISPLWLSAYTDGCEQKLHLDQPHGPWAFVLPISPRFNAKHGGSTLIANQQLLSHWSQTSFQTRARHQPRPLEFDELIERITPDFNRLFVFDPRIPHGVEPVRGPRDLLDARLVVHGWFLPPAPFIDSGGTLTAKQRSDVELIVSQLDQCLNSVLTEWPHAEFPQGSFAYRFEFNPQGKLGRIVPLASSLQLEDQSLRDEFERSLSQVLKSSTQGLRTWPTAKGFSLTYPATLKMEDES